MIDNYNVTSHKHYIYIVCSGKHKILESLNQIYDQETLSVFLSQHWANDFVKNVVFEKFENVYTEDELIESDNNLFCCFCFKQGFYEENGYTLKIWVQKLVINDSTRFFHN